MYRQPSTRSLFPPKHPFGLPAPPVFRRVSQAVYSRFFGGGSHVNAFLEEKEELRLRLRSYTWHHWGGAAVCSCDLAARRHQTASSASQSRRVLLLRRYFITPLFQRDLYPSWSSAVTPTWCVLLVSLGVRWQAYAHPEKPTLPWCSAKARAAGWKDMASNPRVLVSSGVGDLGLMWANIWKA